MTVLHGTATVLRPATHGDAADLADIVLAPDVARWWPVFDADGLHAALERDEGPMIYTIAVDGQVSGAILYVEEPAPAYRHASIDVFLHPARHGEGLGADAVRTLARHLLHDRGHHRVTAHPAADNDRAIKTFTRVGFRPVGVMRSFELGSEGEWHDCLLMDLLATDLA